MDATTTVMTPLLSGLFGAMLTQGVVWYREWTQKQAEASYSALRVAHALEQFADKCSDRVYDVGNFISSKGAIGEQHTALPDVDFVDDINWKQLLPDLVSSAFDISSHARLSNGRIAFTGSMFDLDEASRECANECKRMGMQALTLAARIRRKYKLPALDPTLMKKGYGLFERD